MASFTLSGQRDLAGPMGDLIDRPVALLADSAELDINTSYGPSKAVRAQVVDATTGEDLGLRLVYWASIRAEVLSNTAKDVWTVGTPTEIPQASDPSKTVYVLATEDIDGDVVAAALATYEGEEAPF